MGRVVLAMSVSLDGYFEGPDLDIGWQRVDDELHQYFNDSLRGMSAFLDGRVTYELMAGYWPTADEDPHAPDPVAEFAAIWREMPKVVYSRTLEHADFNSRIARDVDTAAVRALKDASSGDLALGGAQLASAFHTRGLIDEYRLYVHPVLLGSGTPLFRPMTAPVPLRLAETRTFTGGVVMLRHTVDGGGDEAARPRVTPA